MAAIAQRRTNPATQSLHLDRVNHVLHPVQQDANLSLLRRYGIRVDAAVDAGEI